MGVESIRQVVRAEVTVTGSGSFATYLGLFVSWIEDGISIAGGNTYIQRMMGERRLERCASAHAPGCSDGKRRGEGEVRPSIQDPR